VCTHCGGESRRIGTVVSFNPAAADVDAIDIGISDSSSED
jgi:hypothetical protein